MMLAGLSILGFIRRRRLVDTLTKT
jgi:hypothetical protein